MNELERFQDLQLRLVEAGFDTTFRVRREGNQAVSTMTVALHQEQTPEVMATLSDIVDACGFAFTAENETVAITTLS
jgi:hypothetical protein